MLRWRCMERQGRSEEEKREDRRKRRIRNQIISYISLLVIMAAVVLGGIYGVRVWTSQRLLQKENDEEPSESEEIKDLLASEPPLELESESTVVEEEEEPEPEPTPEELLEEIVNSAIEVMPLEDKVAGLFFVTPESITGVDKAIKAGDSTRDALNQYHVGGLVYFAQNMQDKEQLAEMIGNTVVFSSYPLFIGVDEEGGDVSRVAGSGLAEKVSSAREIGETGDAGNAYLAGGTIGAYLAELGFNVDFAPVADVANVDGSVMAKRSYGGEAALAAPFVTSMLQGLKEQGITACLKHFPGIGSTTQDTHDGLAVIGRTAEEFRAEEFTVFQAGIAAGAQMIMVSHAAAPSLTGDNTPSSMSPAVVTDILREELGFDGVVITDAMNMKAISEYYGADEAAISALKAGCDMILMPDDFQLAYDGVLQAVRDGYISEERINDSLRRIYRIKFADRVTQQ